MARRKQLAAGYEAWRWIDGRANTRHTGPANYRAWRGTSPALNGYREDRRANRYTIFPKTPSGLTQEQKHFSFREIDGNPIFKPHQLELFYGE